MVNLVIVTLLVFSAVFDWKYMILPDFSTYILVILALMFHYHNWWVGVLSMGFLLSLHLLTKGNGMGMGDVKYALFMGLLLGGADVMIAFYIAFVTGAIVGVILLLMKKLKKKSHIPFGPFLIGGTFVSWYWGQEILLYLYRWF
jgi:leader peptidase (prepilin peptidase) / N-methyltransferase